MLFVALSAMCKGRLGVFILKSSISWGEGGTKFPGNGDHMLRTSTKEHGQREGLSHQQKEDTMGLSPGPSRLGR
jgi:hypothetical protein